MSSQVAKAARRVTNELHGVVVSAGLMQKTVKVRVGGQKWNKVVNKVREISTTVKASRCEPIQFCHTPDRRFDY